MGMVTEPLTLVVEYCARGSLRDILVKAKASPALGQRMNWPRLLSLAMDCAKVCLTQPLQPTFLWLCWSARVQLCQPLAQESGQG